MRFCTLSDFCELVFVFVLMLSCNPVYFVYGHCTWTCFGGCETSCICNRVILFLV